MTITVPSSLTLFSIGFKKPTLGWITKRFNVRRRFRKRLDGAAGGFLNLSMMDF